MIRVMGFICFVLFFWQLTFVPESNAAIRQKMSRAMSSDNFVKRTTPEEDAAMEAAAAQGNIKAKKPTSPKPKKKSNWNNFITNAKETMLILTVPARQNCFASSAVIWSLRKKACRPKSAS